MKKAEAKPPRFAIINTTDQPSRRMLCEFIPGIGYCYMSRHEFPYLKEYDGMGASRPTAIETFGFSAEVGRAEVVFTRTGESTATYEDGEHRSWQEMRTEHGFSLPLVRGTKRRRRA